MPSHELFVIQRMRIQPLHEILKVFGPGFREVERSGARFGEVVGFVKSGGEEGGDGAEGLQMNVEGLAVGTDGDGNDSFEKISCGGTW